MAEQGVRALWNSPAYHELRDRLDSSDPPDVCRGCSVRHHTLEPLVSVD